MSKSTGEFVEDGRCHISHAADPNILQSVTYRRDVSGQEIIWNIEKYIEAVFVTPEKLSTGDCFIHSYNIWTVFPVA